MIELTEVTSAAMKAWGYDPASRTLAIRFTDSKVSTYPDVPQDVADAFAAHPSKGRAWNELIKNKFDHVAVLDEPAEVRVWNLDDVEYWAGTTAEECLAAARRETGEAYDMEPGYPQALSAEAMARMQFRDDDGETRSFSAELHRLVAEGHKFPCLFSATDC